MAEKERKQHLALAAELLQVHLPAVLAAGDQQLARDLLCVLAGTLRDVRADVEESAVAWEKRGNPAKAAALRREWQWPASAADYAQALSRSGHDIEARQVERTAWLIPVELQAPARRKLSNPERARGACQAARKTARRSRARR